MPDDEPLIDFDQTNGQAEGLDGDSDGTERNDLRKREARKRLTGANAIIGAIGSHPL